ncbi:MAG: AtpZ/AtpI family protein [Planctomycetota bacterium]
MTSHRQPQEQVKTARGNGLGAGLTLAVSVGLFTWFGLWLDARLGTRPWLVLLCIACGIGGGILHLIRVLAPELWPFGKLPRKF